MPFLGTNWILPKSSLVLNFGAIFAACRGPVKMAQKFETSLDLGRIQIVPKNGIFNCNLIVFEIAIAMDIVY